MSIFFKLSPSKKFSPSLREEGAGGRRHERQTAIEKRGLLYYKIQKNKQKKAEMMVRRNSQGSAQQDLNGRVQDANALHPRILFQPLHKDGQEHCNRSIKFFFTKIQLIMDCPFATEQHAILVWLAVSLWNFTVFLFLCFNGSNVLFYSLKMPSGFRWMVISSMHFYANNCSL